MPDLKLYVWHDVLCDYTCGMAVALAATADEARGLLIKTGEIVIGSDLAKEPEEHPVDEPFATYVYGGG